MTIFDLMDQFLKFLSFWWSRHEANTRVKICMVLEGFYLPCLMFVVTLTDKTTVDGRILVDIVDVWEIKFASLVALV